MAFVNGVLFVDAPASALNNAGMDAGQFADNKVLVKRIISDDGAYPYVSAQAFRYWLRTVLEKDDSLEWRAAPVHREQKIAYTDANPIEWWDDDLFGYMRAPKKGGKEVPLPTDIEANVSLTRVSPFRVGTLVSIAPVSIVTDWGTMTRHEGDPVPHEHEFYRAILKGLFSLDISSCGVFWTSARTGFKNLDKIRIGEAERRGLERRTLNGVDVFVLSTEERARRVSSLLKGLARLQGGAKLTLHYTDVTPVVVLVAVTRGGNHIFNYVLGPKPGKSYQLQVNEDALREVFEVYRNDIFSAVYAGWASGFQDEEKEKTYTLLKKVFGENKVVTGHPRAVLERLADDVKERAEEWFALE